MDLPLQGINNPFQMNILRKPTALVLLAVLSIVFSCNEEEEVDPTPIAKLNVENITYDLYNGYLKYDGIDGPEDNYHEFGIYLTSNGLTFDQSNGLPSGKGELFSIFLTTDQSDKLPEGTYTYDGAEDEYFFRIDSGGISIGADAADNSTNILYVIQGGEVEVNYEGNNYTLKVDLLFKKANLESGNFDPDAEPIEIRDTWVFPITYLPSNE